MGIFTDDGGPPTTQQLEPETETEKKDEPITFDTDVEGVKADAEHAAGTDRFPVFKVDKNEFYQNMTHGRKRLRFKSGSNAQQYMSKTKYQRPFYISYTDSQGKTYSRRIK